MSTAAELNSELRFISNNVVGIVDTVYPIAGVRRHVEVTFNCEHDLVLVFVFPEDGEPFAQANYGYDHRSKEDRKSFDEILTPYRICDFASENEDYPYDWNTEDPATHETSVRIASLVRSYLATV